MKVYYKLDVNDIKQLIAEKYGVSTKGIGTCMTPEGPGFMVDMSETETPEPVPFKDYVSPFLAGKKEAPAPETLTVNVTAPAEDIKRFIDKEAEEVKPVRYEDPDEAAEARYKKITDELLQEYIAAGRTISQICKAYELTDSKYSARLYKRSEQFRKEGARLGRKRNKEKAEDTEPTAG